MTTSSAGANWDPSGWQLRGNLSRCDRRC